jgi:hypothetical protein
MSDIPARLELLLDRIDGALAVSLVAADGIPVATARREGGFDPSATLS